MSSDAKAAAAAAAAATDVGDERGGRGPAADAGARSELFADAKTSPELAADGNLLNLATASELNNDERQGGRGGREMVELDATTYGSSQPVELLGNSAPVFRAEASADDQAAHSAVWRANVAVARQQDLEPAHATSEASSSMATYPVAAAAPHLGPDEESRLVEEERRLGDQRATLQETLRLLQEDERLRSEQEAVRRRLADLRQGPRRYSRAEQSDSPGAYVLRYLRYLTYLGIDVRYLGQASSEHPPVRFATRPPHPLELVSRATRRHTRSPLR